MSLRFDRKGSGSFRLRSSFSYRSRSDREASLASALANLKSGSSTNSNAIMSSVGGTGDSKLDLMSWSYRQSKFACDYLNLMDPPLPPTRPINGVNPYSKKGMHLNPLELVEADLCQCDNKTLPPVPLNNYKNDKISSGANGCDSKDKCINNMRHTRRASTVSITPSYASSTISSNSSSTGSFYSDYGFEFNNAEMTPYRFSQATLEETQEDELNQILGELSALQMSLDREIKQPTLLDVVPSTESKTGPGTQNENGGRTDSPDNDSGFSDNASLLSSGSSLSAAGSSSGSSTTSCGLKNNNNANPPPSSVLHASELAALVTAKLATDHSIIPDEKAEKIRIALAKMRAASVTRLYVKAFSKDGSSKALMVDESMTCGRVLALLADKNHVPLSAKWALVEHIPHLHMERIYEDHENMVENLLMWTRDSKNKIFFVEKDDKCDMFLNPQRYFLESKINHAGDCMDEHTKNNLIEEFFNHGVGVPEVESVLYLKAEGKKAWKKFPFVLRASGIYYYPKGKSHANSSKDLVCLAPIDHNQQAYQGIGWKKKFKAPTEYGFVIKPARLQVKSHRHMKYLCAEDPETLRLWMVGLRIAKFGRQIWENYRTLMEDLAHEDLDRFGRSVSLACMPQQNSNQTVMIPQEPHLKITPLRQISQESIQTSASEKTPIQSRRDMIAHPMMPPPPPLPREEGFESDCPVGGTIKRKPSTGLIPKIPLTLNTRSIVGDYINMASGPGEGSTVTLQRKRSLSGNSSASSNSSVSSQIHVNNVPTNQQNGHPRPTSQPGQGKPPTGSLRTAPKPAPVVEESAEVIDYDSLPPPPPELLSADAELPLPEPPRPPVPPAKPSGLYSDSSASSIYSTAGNSSSLSVASVNSSVTNNPPPPPKKGVSFASELSERLKSRADPNHSNSNNIYGNITTTSKSTEIPRKTVSFVSGPPESSLPNKLEEPPQDFLTDLQRVMQKKWQVAQKCNSDKTTTPQEVLGFKFAPEISSLNGAPNVQGDMVDSPKCPNVPVNEQPNTGATNTSHVQAWVSQHYGNTIADLPSMQIQNNRQAPSSPNPSKPPPPQRSSTTYATPGSVINHPLNNPVPCVQNQANAGGIVIYENFQGRKSSQPQVNQFQYDAVHLRNKRPPPPVPKRAESTHLSAHIIFN